jgi:hypothetical protein
MAGPRGWLLSLAKKLLGRERGREGEAAATTTKPDKSGARRLSVHRQSSFQGEVFMY